MSITEVKLSGVGISGSATGGKDAIVSRSYNAQYLVKATTDNLASSWVFDYFQRTPDLPWPGRFFNIGGGYDVESICKTLNVRYTANSEGQFVVDVSYEGLQGSQQQEEKPDQNGQATNNPLEWADEIDVSYTQISIPVEVGEFRGFQPDPIDNRRLRPGMITPIVNSAMKVYDPTIEEESQIKVIRISKYSRESQSEAFNNYIGAINSDRVVINKPAYGFRDSFDPYRGLIKGLTAQFAISNGIPHFRQGIELHISFLLYGWFRPLVDRGLDESRGEGDSNGRGSFVSASELPQFGALPHEPIKDDEGVTISEPVLFNGLGQRLEDGAPPVYLIYNVRKIIPFSPIRW